MFLEGLAYNGSANDGGGIWPWQAGVTTVVVFGAGNDTGAAFEQTLCQAHSHGARVLLPASPRITATDNLSSAEFRHSWVNSAIARLWQPAGSGAWGLPGWDGLNLDILPGEVCKLASEVVWRQPAPVYFKQFSQLQQPLQWKGGVLHIIF